MTQSSALSSLSQVPDPSTTAHFPKGSTTKTLLPCILLIIFGWARSGWWHVTFDLWRTVPLFGKQDRASVPSLSLCTDLRTEVRFADFQATVMRVFFFLFREGLEMAEVSRDAGHHRRRLIRSNNSHVEQLHVVTGKSPPHTHTHTQVLLINRKHCSRFYLVYK